MPLAVAKKIEDQVPINVEGSEAARSYLRLQASKPLEQRVAEIEVWQLGANEALSSVHEIHELASWIKTMIKRWAPVIATAAVSSGLFGGKFAAFLAAFLKAAGFPVS